MRKEIGLWIDHRHAVIVMFLKKGEVIKHITSNVDKRVRYSDGSSEDNRKQRIEEQLSNYYDEIISHLEYADCVLIMGPGEAKVELEKRLHEQKHPDCMVVLKTTEQMTPDEIVAAVHRHFPDSAKRIFQRREAARYL